MADRRFTYLCALGGAVAFYIAYQEWFAWLLLVGLMGLPWLSLLISLPGMLTFRAQLDAPDFLPMGTESQIQLVGTSRFPVPPFRGQIRLHRCLTGESWRHKKGTALAADHCGGIRMEPEKVWVCDYLGLFRFRCRRGDMKTLLVRPRTVQMEAPPDLNRFLARSWRPKPGGGFAENHELRLYRPGDNLNQVHWKLTAKTGKLIIREAMEPNRGLVLLTLEIRGTGEELDRKFGRLLWLGNYLLEQNIGFEIRALTGEGPRSWAVDSEDALKKSVDQLICCAPAAEGAVLEQEFAASWHHHIGGESDEA